MVLAEIEGELRLVRFRVVEALPVGDAEAGERSPEALADGGLGRRREVINHQIQRLLQPVVVVVAPSEDVEIRARLDARHPAFVIDDDVDYDRRLLVLEPEGERVSAHRNPQASDLRIETDRPVLLQPEHAVPAVEGERPDRERGEERQRLHHLSRGVAGCALKASFDL